VTVTVAIPVRNGGPLLERVLEAVRAQRLEGGDSAELLVCDSGSTDGSVAVARAAGAELIEIAPEEFSHGGTRNLLMDRAQGDRVAFLTQDAVPRDESWLAGLLGGFELAEDVALAFGPYVPRPDASPMVARELSEWFRSLAPDHRPRIDRLGVEERDVEAAALFGARGYFTDANGCVSKAAWDSVRFRTIEYAEDHALAHDLLRAGFAKVFVPDAAVVHSHAYSGSERLRRSFDEARAIQQLYGVEELRHWRPKAMEVWGLVGADLRWATRHGGDRPRSSGEVLATSLAHHLMGATGAMLGARADRLPSWLVRRLSLEGRACQHTAPRPCARSRTPPLP
jgi:rhamnosyltransferase